jgi:hypothetical protein
MFEDIFILIIRIILLFFGFYDFLYTTISVSSASVLTNLTGKIIQNLVKFLSKVFGRAVFDYCGMLVNISLIITWICIIWLGLFLVFTFDKQSIIQDDDQAANAIERLYYTGTVLSTLGMGNFFPNSSFTSILTSIFSFAGFIFFTTSMTYLISVYEAVINKRDFSSAIRQLGNNPSEVIQQLQKFSQDYRMIETHGLKQKLDKVTQQYKAYPIIYYYHHSEVEQSFSKNLAVLDEAVCLMNSKSSFHNEEWEYFKSSIESFLQHLYDNNKTSIDAIKLSIDQAPSYPQDNESKQFETTKRKKVLQFLLESEKITWNDVYH